MSHDEAIHASLTHSLVERLDYTQDPTYHGPLLYHLTGLSFFLFGDNDATARLPVALAGCRHGFLARRPDPRRRILRHGPLPWPAPTGTLP